VDKELSIFGSHSIRLFRPRQDALEVENGEALKDLLQLDE
jgi:hypothetical protein